MGAAQPGEAPFAACPLFDRAGYVAWPSPEFPFRLVFGGPMVRLLHEGRDDVVYLHKVPLVHWRPELRSRPARITSTPSAWPPRRERSSTSSA